MEKQEKNNVRKIINSYIKRKNYGEYTGIIKEIIERRYLMYASTMNEDRIKEELEAFVHNLKKIRYADSRDYEKDDSNTMAYFSHERNEIVINRNRIKNTQELYKILTHEIYHVLGTPKSNDGTALKYYDEKKNEYVGTALNESFNEYGAYLGYTQNRKQTEKEVGVRTSGYQMVVFAPRLLSAAFGIPEATVVGRGLQNREEFLPLVCGLNEDNKAYKDRELCYFEKFESNLNILFNLDYKKDSFSYLTEEAKNEVRAASTKNILEYAYTRLARMVIKDTSSINNLSKDEINKFAYCFYKLEDISKEVIGQIKDDKAKKELEEWVKSRRDFQGTLITDINKIVSVSDKITNIEDYRNYLKLACEGNIDLAIDWINVKYRIDISKEKVELEESIPKEDALNSEFAKFMEERDYKDFSSLDSKRKIAMIRLKIIEAKEKINKVIVPKILRATGRLLGVQEKLPEYTEKIEQQRVETKEISVEKPRETKPKVVETKKETNDVEEKKKASNIDKDDDEER